MQLKSLDKEKPPLKHCRASGEAYLFVPRFPLNKGSPITCYRGAGRAALDALTEGSEYVFVPRFPLQYHNLRYWKRRPLRHFAKQNRKLSFSDLCNGLIGHIGVEGDRKGRHYNITYRFICSGGACPRLIANA